jgi:RNA polymerase sigma factor (sigma-70 family)
VVEHKHDPEYDEDEITKLYKCLKELSDQDREVCQLYYLEERGIEEVACELGVTYGSVRWIKDRAVKRLRICCE